MFHIKIKKKNTNNTNATSYANFLLNPTQKYVFRVRIQSNQEYHNNWILFGLISDSKVDISNLHSSGLSYNERGDSCMNINKVIKGTHIFEGYK